MRDEPLECPMGRQEGCRQIKSMSGEGEAAGSVSSWGAASLLRPVWASGCSRASRPFRSTPGDNATPTGFPGVVRRVDRLSLDPLGFGLPGGVLPGWLRGRSAFGVGVSSPQLTGWGPTPSSPHLRGSFVTVDGHERCHIRMKGVDQ